MLAASAPDTDAAVQKSGLPVFVDAKLDGVRVQIHKLRDTVRIFTRSLDEVTERMPLIVETVAALPYRQLVLDGEALALRPDGGPEVFQQIASSAATRTRSDETSESRVSLQAYVFDLLRIDDQDLLDSPLTERVAIMNDALPPELLVPRIEAERSGQVADFFADVVSRGFEGVVIKNPRSPYAAGRRAVRR